MLWFTVEHYTHISLAMLFSCLQDFKAGKEHPRGGGDNDGGGGFPKDTDNCRCSLNHY